MNLENFRRDAAYRSGGISNWDIYSVALRQAHAVKNSPSRILDYGAGTGDFTKEISKYFPGSSVNAVDIMPRPIDFDPGIGWTEMDLNDVSRMDANSYDLVFAVEVFEHLENPRKTMRDIFSCLAPNGVAIITTPNVLSIRSLLTISTRGHFAAFDDANYPAHITPLSTVDLWRCALEAGFVNPRLFFMNNGKIPKLLTRHWKDVPLLGSYFKGRLFSDNYGIVVTKP
ncbi:class I SAM-dependent methyltransferase [Methylobacterium sp. A54F]